MKTTIRYRNLKPVAVEKEASLGPAVPFSCLSSSDELQLVTLTDARPSTTFVWQNSDKQTCCTDFYFDIPNSVTVPTSECKSPSAGQSLQLLPPSLRLRKVIRNQSEFNYGHSSHVVDNTSGAGEVLYQVSARLIFQGRPIAKTSREILLIPIVEPSPPLDIGDFAGEYQVAASASVTTISKMKSWGELLVTTVEPEPLMLSLENSAALSVSKVLLKFLFQQHISDVARTPSAGPDLLECEVVTNLEATTYFSMAEQPYALSSKEAARSPLVAQETTLSRPQVHKIRLVPWKEIQGAACKSKSCQYLTSLLFIS
jgi:hypothetical protein